MYFESVSALKQNTSAGSSIHVSVMVGQKELSIVKIVGTRWKRLDNATCPLPFD